MRLLLPAVTMRHTVTADGVLTVLNSERGTTSIVLVDELQRPRFTPALQHQPRIGVVGVADLIRGRTP